MLQATKEWKAYDAGKNKCLSQRHDNSVGHDSAARLSESRVVCAPVMGDVDFLDTGAPATKCWKGGEAAEKRESRRRSEGTTQRWPLHRTS